MQDVDAESLRRDLELDGFSIIRSVVSSATLDRLGHDLEAAYAASEKFRGGGSFSGHLNCSTGEAGRATYEELVERGLVDAVAQIRPHQASRVRGTLNYNLPGSTVQHYHIDGLYTDDFLVVNVAVVDTSVVNGAIDVLPGTHREFTRYWRHAVERRYRRSTRIEMQQGDLLVRRSNLWHRGMPNTSAAARPMFAITFGEASAPEGDPFLGDIRFYPNWYSTSTVGRARERLVVAAPVTYHAYRFVKSLYSDKGNSTY